MEPRFSRVFEGCLVFVCHRNEDPPDVYNGTEEEAADQRPKRPGPIRQRSGARPQEGGPNKATVEVRAACVAIVDDPQYRTKLLARARAGTLPPAVECMLWHYAKGKPKDQVEHSGGVVLSWE